MKQLTTKLHTLQSQVGVIEKQSINFYKKPYADHASIMEVVQPLLTAQKLVWLQPVQVSADQMFVVIRNHIIDIESGEEYITDASIPIGANLTPQAFGSAVTYGRRYTMCALLNLVTDDDDGQRASQPLQGSFYTDAEKSGWTTKDVHEVLKAKGIAKVSELSTDKREAFAQHIKDNPK